MAEGMQAALRVEKGLVGGGEDHAGGADGGADVAGTHDAHAQCSGSLIAGARDHRCSRTQSSQGGRFRRDRAGNLMAFEQRGRMLSGISTAASISLGPAALGNVQQQRAGSVRHIHGLLAGQPEAHVVLGQQEGAKFAAIWRVRARAPRAAWSG